MGEPGHPRDVDKLVSDFLSELNALSDSLERAAPAKPAPEPKAEPEQPASVPEPEQPASSNPVRYRNIDILLMDDAQAAPVNKTDEEDDLLQRCRPLYRSRFHAALRRGRILVWAAAAVLVLCAVGVLYMFNPFGSGRPEPAVTAASALSPAVPIDKIIPVYPRRARRLGIKGTVELEVDVDEQGKVLRATPVSGPAQLHSAAAQAVTKCRFKPAQRDGVNVKSTLRLSVPFNP